MTRITDELIAAYADGETNDAESAAVEAALEQSADARARLARHQALQKEIDKNFSSILAEPIPAPIAALLGGESRVSTGGWRNVARSWRVPAAMAASLTAGFFLASTFNRPQAPTMAVLTPSMAIITALDTVRNGDAASSVHVVASYRNAEDAVCREFDVPDAAAPVKGLACRTPGEGWRLAALEPGMPNGAYLPAGAAEEDSAITALTATMRPMSASETDAFLAALSARD